ncbi:MAG TPA: hypothetical protein P5567_10755 [Kiritimatiellia bacterium]|nr:hypothetical protein [Kiritimatiellia bacterium]HRZ12920.1 hypothetical protein [Kiritimatiellia bacterium]HSA18470.1 hypothetical protein [Kiritimatiellia bacterium]
MITGVAELPALPSRRAPAPLPPRPDRRHHTVSWGLGILLAVAWHLAWLAGFSWHPETPRPAMASAPTLVYAATPEEAEDSADPRLLWSPALFSLPSAAGFSAPALAERFSARPAAGVWESAPLMLERDGRTGRAGRGDSLQEEVAANLFLVPLPPLEATVFRGPPRAPSASVEFRPGWSEDDFEDMPLPAGWGKTGDRAWEATAYLEMDAGGAAEHVFLESPSECPEVNRLLEKALWNWRIKPGASAASGRVVFRAPGAGEEAP